MSTEHTAAPAIADMSEQTQIRPEKRAKLIESGREAYRWVCWTRGSSEGAQPFEDLRAEYDPKLAAEGAEGWEETDRWRCWRPRGVRPYHRLLCFVTRSGGTEGASSDASLAEVGEESLTEWKSLLTWVTTQPDRPRDCSQPR